MNKFLQSRAEISDCTKWLMQNSYVSHPISCKDFDLANILPNVVDGNMIDLGSAGGSNILLNCLLKKTSGVKIGIDLSYSEEDIRSSIPGIDLIKGDALNTPFPDKFFNTVFCLSVIEHEVDFSLLAKECSRLLQVGGKLFITFDYWPHKIDTDGLRLYGLKWNILDKTEVNELVSLCAQNNLTITSEIDWQVKDAVISPSYCSPFPGISYTFGILEFIKA